MRPRRGDRCRQFMETGTPARIRYTSGGPGDNTSLICRMAVYPEADDIKTMVRIGGKQAMTGPVQAGGNARVRALVRGRVQGVFYRDFTCSHARRIGVFGWVRNLADGATVEVVAEGPEPALQQLLDNLRRGPRGSRVVTVDTEWASPEGSFISFDVR